MKFNLDFVAEMCDNELVLMLDFVETFVTLTNEFQDQVHSYLFNESNDSLLKEQCHKIYPTYQMFLLTDIANKVKEIENTGAEKNIKTEVEELPLLIQEAILKAKEAAKTLEIEITNQQNL
jgi:hypothetical protein